MRRRPSLDPSDLGPLPVSTSIAFRRTNHCS
uniref:Uncharacterized protein n=1 Tax=Anguilla anguilla TaxID=7936 RepID=A0A0E9Q4E8_ANGAN